MKYIQLTVITNSDYADIISLDMIEAGSEGTSVTDSRDVKDVLRQKNFWDYYDDELLSDDARVLVRGFFPKDCDLSDLKEKIAGYGSEAGVTEVLQDEIDSGDYENEWKKYYAPIEIGRVAIVPEWLDYAGALTQVRLDPGMAFGTGNHETTSMCIELMQEADLTGKRVYDIGCGSGILGITAAKLGAETVVMADIDENAVKAARDNAILNGVKCEILQGDLFAGKTDPADLIVANITADVLLRLKKLFKPLLKPCGMLIISGIINERAPEIESAFSELKLVKRLKKGEWQAFAYTV